MKTETFKKALALTDQIVELELRKLALEQIIDQISEGRKCYRLVEQVQYQNPFTENANYHNVMVEVNCNDHQQLFAIDLMRVNRDLKDAKKKLQALNDAEHDNV